MRYQETSREALEAFAPVSAELDLAIVQAIEASPDGLCDWEIEEKIGRLHQAVSGNRRHLVERGVIVDSGRKRVKPNGRKTIVWILGKAPNLQTPQGQALYPRHARRRA